MLAQGDPSLALVYSMHPSVLSFWRDPKPPAGSAPGWEAQCREVFEAAREGAWWGTITSEPGSGGEARVRLEEEWRVGLEGPARVTVRWSTIGGVAWWRFRELLRTDLLF